MTVIRILIVAGLAVLAGPPFGPLDPNAKPPAPVKPGAPVPVPSKPVCGSMQVNLPAPNPGVLLLAQGDADVNDNHRLSVDVRLFITRGRVHLSTTVLVEGQDATDYRAHDFEAVEFDLPAGCEIAGVSQTTGKIDQRRSGHDFTKSFGSGLIDYALCRTDTNGDDVGKLRCKEIVLKPVTLTLATARTMCPSSYHLGVPRQAIKANHQSGDDDMGGNVVDVAIDATGRLVGERIMVDTSLTMTESVPDHSTFAKTTRVEIFDVAKDYPDCKIESVSGATGRIRSHRKKNEHTGYPISKDIMGDIVEGNLLKSAKCRSDTDGSDDGKLGCGEIAYNYMTVVMKPK